MKTVSTKIKDFKQGDRFVFDNQTIFEVISEPTSWANHGGKQDNRLTHGAKCKFVSSPGNKPVDSLLKSYDWMQGIEEVTYEKICEN